MRTLAYLMWKPWYNARGLYWRDVTEPLTRG